MNNKDETQSNINLIYHANLINLINFISIYQNKIRINIVK